MENIKSYTSYNNAMCKALKDKLFFLNYLEIDKLVDFGCANGALLKEIKNRLPLVKILGYDIDTEMINLSKKNGIKCVSNWNKVKDFMNINTTLLLSSVIHEIFSYSSSIQCKETFDNIFHSGFKNIVIRDMLPTYEIDIIELSKSDIEKLYKYANKKYLDSYISVYGEVKTYRSLIHFLLKYRYKANWNREVLENYLPINNEEFIKMIPNNYRITYEENYTLDYIKKIVKKDFDIDIQCNTHTKLILKRV